MNLTNPPFSNDLSKLAIELYQALEGHIIMGIPIGVGKPVQMVNALYQAAKNNPEYQLDIHTALSLARPQAKSDLEKRLLGPFFDRQFKDVAELDFVADGRAQSLPKNVRIVEFYFKPGEMLKNPGAQQNVLSANYTHVARDMIGRNVNLVTQLVSKRNVEGQVEYSLSSNPDVTLDLQRMMRKKTELDGKPRFMIGQVNPELPFMPRDARVEKRFFDHVVDDEALYTPVFCAPHQPIPPVDHLIGFYTSTLIEDGGTLQIGIGSLGDAVVNSLLVRQQKNNDYRAMLHTTGALEKFPIIEKEGGCDRFNQGLYGNTEMLVPGYLELKKGGVLKRKVFEDVTIQTLVNDGMDPNRVTLDWIDKLLDLDRITPYPTQEQIDYLVYWGLFKPSVKLEDDALMEGTDAFQHPNFNGESCRRWIKTHALGQSINHATLMHGGFFVGNHHFYDDLRNMPEDELNEINMTSVSFTNQLHGDEPLKMAQRKKARFINACMKTTLSGAAVSDGLEDGQVVSGVGGQFNFVAMAHELPDARSILMMRSCRTKGTKVVSNIVFNYGHITIPRHMRDVVVTEYGIADLRGKNDQEIIEALIAVADSRFQPSLVRQAQEAGKLPLDYQVPESARSNTPEWVASLLSGHLAEDFTPFPFGKELTDQEVLIGGALKRLKANLAKKWPLLIALMKPVDHAKLEANLPHLARMNLDAPSNLKERLFRRLLLTELPDAQSAKLTPMKKAAHHS